MLIDKGVIGSRIGLVSPTSPTIRPPDCERRIVIASRVAPGRESSPDSLLWANQIQCRPRKASNIAAFCLPVGLAMLSFTPICCGICQTPAKPFWQKSPVALYSQNFGQENRKAFYVRCSPTRKNAAERASCHKKGGSTWSFANWPYTAGLRRDCGMKIPSKLV